MRLKWYGQASFLITPDSGPSIVTDPYTPETSGYKPVQDAPEIVIRSSDNDTFHCRADLIPGQPLVIDALKVAQSGGQREERGVSFQAIEAMEALNHRFHEPDQNAMYRFAVDGINVGHMGDMGNPLTEEQLTFFKGVDVLLALAGGHPTIELPDLKTMIAHVRPRLIVPMHFRTLRLKLTHTLWIQSFLDYFEPGDVDFAFDSETTITQDSLPESTRVLVLDHV
jgi:L-ascorbate metabolism protein UlaG (beta-lactamase superfamily)